MPTKKNDPDQDSAGEQSSLTPSSQEDASAINAEPTAPTLPDQFRSFLVALATDPQKLGTFIKDPDGAMAAAGIEAVDQAILKSGNGGMIHARLLGQKFSFTPPPPTTVLVVDMTKQSGGEAEQPTVRTSAFSPVASSQGSFNMYPYQQGNPQQIFPQIHPQQIFPQIHPQQIFPQIHPQQIFPQVHPQQIFPQVHPQQIFPQVHPQQIFPQIHPQQIFPQVQPQ
jgi:hypothetical protein